MRIIPFALLLIGQYVYAQQPPLSNGQMQQIPNIPKPSIPNPKVVVRNQATLPAPTADQTKIRVKNLKITGAAVYSEADLIRIAGFQTDTDLNLDQLREMATRISNFYHNHGYFVAQAYLPAQDVREGNLTIAVLEGHYGKIAVRNQSRVSDGLINGYLTDLHENATISAPALENGLLLLSDLPGIKLNSVLSPGTNLGDSDLTVEVLPGDRFSGSVR